jgi:hypothetical protein
VTVIQPLAGASKPTKYDRFTAIDDGTRLRVLRIYPKCNQQTASQFLDDVLERLPFRVEVIQTDNGPGVRRQFPLAGAGQGAGHVDIKPRTLGSTARSSAPTASTPRSSTGCSRES